MEKELYYNQVESLEGYFRKIDEAMAAEDHKAHLSELILDEPTTSDVEHTLYRQQREIFDLKDRQKMLHHQLTIAQAERDGFRKQLNDAKVAAVQEIARKAKVKEKVRHELDYLMRVHHFLKQLILNQYKSLQETPAHPTRNRTINKVLINPKSHTIKESAPATKGESLDVPLVYKLQAALEDQLSTPYHQEVRLKVERSNVQIEVLGRVLRGEPVLTEDLRKVGIQKEQKQDKVLNMFKVCQLGYPRK